MMQNRLSSTCSLLGNNLLNIIFDNNEISGLFTVTQNGVTAVAGCISNNILTGNIVIGGSAALANFSITNNIIPTNNLNIVTAGAATLTNVHVSGNMIAAGGLTITGVAAAVALNVNNNVVVGSTGMNINLDSTNNNMVVNNNVVNSALTTNSLGIMSRCLIDNNIANGYTVNTNSNINAFSMSGNVSVGSMVMRNNGVGAISNDVTLTNNTISSGDLIYGQTGGTVGRMICASNSSNSFHVQGSPTLSQLLVENNNILGATGIRFDNAGNLGSATICGNNINAAAIRCTSSAGTNVVMGNNTQGGGFIGFIAADTTTYPTGFGFNK
jgi:hypothetical protein